jgi:hypothetical protein
VPFHKLTQWLCYSLLEPIESVAGWKVERGDGQTGLPEVSLRVGRGERQRKASRRGRRRQRAGQINPKTAP